MQLSKIQSELVIEIANQNVLHIHHLLEKYCNLESINRGTQPFTHQTIKNRSMNIINNIVYVPQNIKNAKDTIVEFIALVKLLEKEELIIQIPYTIGGLIFPMARKIFSGNSFHLEPDKFIQGLIASIDEIEIYPLPALSKFIENNFMTEKDTKELSEQIKYNEERRDRKLSQLMTIVIALFSIIVSIATAIFNFYTYDKQRNVTITNPNAFQDTTKILILGVNKQNGKIDTINTIKIKPKRVHLK